MSSDICERTATQAANHPSALETYGHLSYEPWLALAAYIDQFIRDRFSDRSNRSSEAGEGH